MKKLKYKEGDKVRIKTWKAMSEEYSISTSGNIAIHMYSNYAKEMEDIIIDLDTDREVIIKEVVELGKIEHYKIEESNTKWVWTDEMIECVAVPVESIESRFEILDL